MPSSYEDIEAISALARIPRTPDGPDWAKASPHDLKLATNLVTSEWKYAERVARGALAARGGAIPYAQRHCVDEFVDDPGDQYDDAKFAEDIRPAVRQRGGFFKDSHFDDVLSNVFVWMHEAACKFDGRGAWRPYLASVIASRVADHLKKRPVAGTTNNKDDAPAQPCSRSDRAEDFELEGVFAAAAAEVAAHLKVLRRCQDKFGAGVLRALASYNSSYAEIAGRAGKSKSRVHEKGQKILAKLPALADAMSVARIINNNKELSEENRTILENIRNKYNSARRTVDDPFELEDFLGRRAFARECSRPNTGEKCHRPSSLRALDEPGRVRFRGPYVYGHHRRQQAAVRGARQELTAYLSGPISRNHRSEFDKPNGNPPDALIKDQKHNNFRFRGVSHLGEWPIRRIFLLVAPACDLVIVKINGGSLRLAAYFIKRGRLKPWASGAVSGNYRWIPSPASLATPKTRRVRRSQSSSDESSRRQQPDVMVAIAPNEFISERAAGELRLQRYESCKQALSPSVRSYRRPAQ